MSILKRTGTGINDVAYQDGIAAGQKVFTKDQKWSTTAAGGTYNCLHRTGSGIADVAYQNETIGKALSTYGVGSIVKVRENNSLVDFIVLSHSYPASGRTLLIRKDIHSERQIWETTPYPTAPYYSGSKLDNWLNSDYINQITEKVRSNIAGVSITVRQSDGQAYGGMIQVSKKIFLLSSTELIGNAPMGNYEGSQISYFSDNAKRIANYNGKADIWWTRSNTRTGSTYGFYTVLAGGSLSSVDGDISRGVRPAFTLPSNILVNSSTNEVIG